MPIDTSPGFWKRLLQQSPNMLASAGQRTGNPALQGAAGLAGMFRNRFQQPTTPAPTGTFPNPNLLRPTFSPTPSPTPNPGAGPIDTGPTALPPVITRPTPQIYDKGYFPGGSPALAGPDYTNPYQTQVPDMALTQNIGQNIRKTGGIRSAYGGSAAGLAGGPFKKQLFY